MYDHLFYSSSRSAVQFILNTENFYEQISRVPPCSIFVSSFQVTSKQKNLKSFSLEDFSKLPDLIPEKLRKPEVRPQDVLKYIIEEFKPHSKEFQNIQVVKIHASNFKDLEVLNTDKKSQILEIVWDLAPSASAVAELVENIEKNCPLGLQGLITARGFFYSTHIKNKSNWKSFEDGRLHTWPGLAANLISSFSYPVLLYLTPKSSQGAIEDFSRLKDFAKLQDSVFSLKIKEEKIAEKERVSSGNQNSEKIERSISDTLRHRYKSCQSGTSDLVKDLGYYEKYIKESIVSKYSDTQGVNKTSFCIKSEFLNPSLSKTNLVAEPREMSTYVFKVVDSDKDIMPEIKMFCHKKHSKSTDLQNSTSSSNNVYLNTHSSKQEPWNCPKCSQMNPESSYECTGCRVISWDKFYNIRTKPLSRSGRSSTKPEKSRRGVDGSDYRYNFSHVYSQGVNAEKMRNSSSLGKYY